MTHNNILPQPFPGFGNFNNLININPVQTNQKPDKKTYHAIKPGKNGTHIWIVLDESSSMGSVFKPTLDGFNKYLDEQKKNPNKCTFSLSKFNGGTPSKVFSGIDITGAPVLTGENYRPGGSTNLYDAIGDAITNIDSQLKALKKKERPAVLVTIMTDGEENCSSRFTQNDIKDMIKEREKLGWIFIYLGANQDAWAVGNSFGVSGQNTMSYDVAQMGQTFAKLSSQTTAYRGAMASGVAASTYSAKGFFSDTEDKK